MVDTAPAPRPDPSRPYDALPALPPRVDIETRALLKACIEARTALAELKQATGHLPNPAVLINVIPILEAQASSEIENIVTSTDELFRFAAAPDSAESQATREVHALADIDQRAGFHRSPRWS